MIQPDSEIVAHLKNRFVDSPSLTKILELINSSEYHLLMVIWNQVDRCFLVVFVTQKKPMQLLKWDISLDSQPHLDQFDVAVFYLWIKKSFQTDSVSFITLCDISNLVDPISTLKSYVPQTQTNQSSFFDSFHTYVCGDLNITVSLKYTCLFFHGSSLFPHLSIYVPHHFLETDQDFEMVSNEELVSIFTTSSELLISTEKLVLKSICENTKLNKAIFVQS